MELGSTHHWMRLIESFSFVHIFKSAVALQSHSKLIFVCPFLLANPAAPSDTITSALHFEKGNIFSKLKTHAFLHIIHSLPRTIPNPLWTMEDNGMYI